MPRPSDPRVVPFRTPDGCAAPAPRALRPTLLPPDQPLREMTVAALVFSQLSLRQTAVNLRKKAAELDAQAADIQAVLDGAPLGADFAPPSSPATEDPDHEPVS